MIQCINMQKAETDLTEEKSIQIAAYTDCRNGKYYKRDSKKNPEDAVDERQTRFTKAIQNAGECNICIKKRTDE